MLAQVTGVLALGGAYFWDLLRTLLALSAVCLLVWFVLRALGQRGFGGVSASSGALRVVQRIPLDARKSLYVVRAGQRVLLLGTGESGPPSLITELDPSVLDQAPSASPPEEPRG